MAKLGSSIFPASNLGPAGHTLGHISGWSEGIWFGVVNGVAQCDVLVRIRGVCLVQIVAYVMKHDFSVDCYN